MESSYENKSFKNEVAIPFANITLEGNLEIPDSPQGIIIFAHGSGSSRFSNRNQFVANYLQQGNFATLLFDLLTKPEEDEDMFSKEYRFNIPLLTERLLGVTDWIINNPGTENLRIGYFGASTGAAAALIAAVRRMNHVYAVVSRGGRPDLADQVLHELKTPTLFVVGGNDLPVIELNQQALHKIHSERQLEIIPGAGHLFEEEGMLQEVARLSLKWFESYLIPNNEDYYYKTRT